MQGRKGVFCIQNVFERRTIRLILVLIALYLGVRYLLPVSLPFLAGALLALAAEPLVSLCVKGLKLPRGVAAGVGVSLSVFLLMGILTVLGAAALRQLAGLQLRLPDLTAQAQSFKDWLIATADKAPEAVRSLAQRTVLEAFDDGQLLMEQVTTRLPGLVTGLGSFLGSSVLSVGTGLLSAYLISARLPLLGKQVKAKLPAAWAEKGLPALKRLLRSLWAWCKAQAGLAGITFLIVSAGLWLMKIPRSLLLGFLIALVDAVPILGTGTVLVPWAVIVLLQGNLSRGVGLLATYAVAAVTRTVLEPRLLGRQLGLDPLATLIAMYFGYRFWGIPGLLFTPILASAAVNIMTE